MASNAQNKTLSTPELLVCILSQLPHSALLKARLVHSTWASVFTHAMIEAALFKRPRPKGSALYTQIYSDVLSPMFSSFFPHMFPNSMYSSDRALIAGNDVEEEWPTTKGNGTSVDMLSDLDLQTMTTLQPLLPGHRVNRAKWPSRQLVVCQPAVEVLEMVLHVDRPGGATLEFRTTIARCDGLRIGFLYDAVRHWDETERLCELQLFWKRKTGDLINNYDTYEGNNSYKTTEDKPCVTLWGRTKIQNGLPQGPTYTNYLSKRHDRHAEKLVPQMIKSVDDEVAYSMFGPKVIGINKEIFDASYEDNMQHVWDDGMHYYEDSSGRLRSYH